MAVAVRPGPELELGTPEPLDEIRFAVRRSNSSYDLGRDGRFLILMPSGSAQRPEIVVVLDRASELRRQLGGMAR